MNTLLLALLACGPKAPPPTPTPIAVTTIGESPFDIPSPDPDEHFRPTIFQAEVRHGRILAIGNQATPGRWIRDVANGELITLEPDEVPGPGERMSLLPDGYVLIDGDALVRVDIDGTHRWRTPLFGNPTLAQLDGLATLAASDDGERLMLATRGEVGMVDGDGNVLWHRLIDINRSQILLSPSGRRAYVSISPSVTRTMVEVDVDTGEELAKADLWDRSKAADPVWVGEQLFLADRRGNLRAVDLASPKTLFHCTALPGRVVDVLQGEAGEPTLFATEGGAVLSATCGHNATLLGRLPTDGRVGLEAFGRTDDGFVGILSQGEVIHTDTELNVQPPLPVAGTPLTVALSPDGTLLALAPARGPVRIYDLRQRTLTLTDVDSCGIDPLSFSPDGSRVHIASCTREGRKTFPRSGWFAVDGSAEAFVDGGLAGFWDDGVLFVPKGTELVAVGEDPAPRDWGCELVAAISEDGTPLGLCTDGRVLGAEGQELAQVPLPEKGLRRLVDLPGRTRFAVLWDGILMDCDKRGCTERSIPDRFHAPAIAQTARGPLVLGRSSDGSNFFLETLDDGTTAPLPDGRIPVELAASANGHRLAILFQGAVHVLEVDDLALAE